MYQSIDVSVEKLSIDTLVRIIPVKKNPPGIHRYSHSNAKIHAQGVMETDIIKNYKNFIVGDGKCK